jgi:hypothetical protein
MAYGQSGRLSEAAHAQNLCRSYSFCFDTFSHSALTLSSHTFPPKFRAVITPSGWLISKSPLLGLDLLSLLPNLRQGLGIHNLFGRESSEVPVKEGDERTEL